MRDPVIIGMAFLGLILVIALAFVIVIEVARWRGKTDADSGEVFPMLTKIWFIAAIALAIAIIATYIYILIIPLTTIYH